MSKNLSYDIKITNADKDCYEDVQKLCDERFGNGYINRSTFDKWLLHGDLFKQVKVHGRFAGFSVMVPASAEKIANYMHMPIEDVLKAAGDKPPVIYKSAAVTNEFEGMGIVNTTLGLLIDLLREKGFGTIFASAWTFDGKMPMSGMFKRYNFQKLYKREMLWYNEEDYSCVVCNGRCVCDAMIYIKTLGA